LIITLNVLKINQNFINIYVTVMKASDLLYYCKIDRWDEKNPEGYQRALLDTRVNSAARYLLDEDGIFPTSILVNVRGKTEFIPSTSLDSYAELGVLRIPHSSLPFWIIDGQHRLIAIKLASKENPRLDNFAIPISIITFNSQYEEMRMFYIVNSRQKSVPTGLALEHLNRTVIEKGEEQVRKYEQKNKFFAALSIPILKILNTHPRSPWYNKIILPNEKRKPNHVISQVSFADSLGRILKELNEDELKEIKMGPLNFSLYLINYWLAISEIYPEAFKNPKEYIIQKTHGCYTFHLLYIDIYNLCKLNNNYSKEYVKEILLRALNRFSLDENNNATSSEFWNRTTGTSLGGMKAVNILVDKIRSHLQE